MRRPASVPPFAVLLLALLCAPSAPAPVAAQAGPIENPVAAVPTPESHFGFRPGESRRLANWAELTAYYEKVARSSPRMRLDTLGTASGQPMVMFTISSPENLARLDRLHEIQMKLADPRRVSGPAELARLKEEARTVVLVTSNIHSTEVGSGQMPANLVYRLAASQGERVREILDNAIVLLVPSLNPYGTQAVPDWYRRWVGTEWEAAPPPFLYQPYVGHDNNRDWYAFTQEETRLAIDHAHNAWHPMIVHDVHQMGGTGARIFFPPYVEPFERNVDPLLIASINQLGSYMAAELISEGKTGVVTNAQYDLFTPARAYQHYHGGARILSETASARLATPVTLAPDDLQGRRGFDANRPSMNFPVPWTGGEWGLPQIVDYQESGVLALLTNAARNRRFWVDNFWEINRRAVEGWADWPAAWVIPADQAERPGLSELLRILRTADVEVHRAEAPFTAAGRGFGAGSWVVPMNQPYASFAQTMLEIQDYPDLFDYPGGPPTRPYDVTAHTLPLLLGVEAVPVEQPLDVPLSDVVERPALRWETPAELRGRRAPRIGVYKGWDESMPAGWTRWVLDQHGIAYDTLHNADFQRGDLHRRYDVILFQDQDADEILEGWSAEQMPPEYAGGIGEQGVQALRRFVERGGRVVAVENATELVIDAFDLDLDDLVADVPPEEFYIPGSILRLDVEPAVARRAGADAENIAWFWRSSRAWDVDDPRATVLARYGADPRLSGWVLGAERIAGEPAIVEADIGRGSVVLFGFQPNYRAQTVATWPLLWDALTPR